MSLSNEACKEFIDNPDISAMRHIAIMNATLSDTEHFLRGFDTVFPQETIFQPSNRGATLIHINVINAIKLMRDAELEIFKYIHENITIDAFVVLGADTKHRLARIQKIKGFAPDTPIILVGSAPEESKKAINQIAGYGILTETDKSILWENNIEEIIEIANIQETPCIGHKFNRYEMACAIRDIYYEMGIIQKVDDILERINKELQTDKDRFQGLRFRPA